MQDEDTIDVMIEQVRFASGNRLTDRLVDELIEDGVSGVGMSHRTKDMPEGDMQVQPWPQFDYWCVFFQISP
jgi:hypothetical protein